MAFVFCASSVAVQGWSRIKFNSHEHEWKTKKQCRFRFGPSNDQAHSYLATSRGRFKEKASGVKIYPQLSIARSNKGNIRKDCSPIMQFPPASINTSEVILSVLPA
jgi:hypothetical protein